MLSVVCCPLCVVSCVLFVDGSCCGWLFDVFVVGDCSLVLFARCRLGWSLVVVVPCVLFVVCCVLAVLVVVGWLLFFLGGGSLFGVYCLLLLGVFVGCCCC